MRDEPRDDWGTMMDASELSLGRRRFVGGVSAGVASTLLPGSAVAVTPAPRRGGRLRVALGHGDGSDVLDPARSQNAFMGSLIFTAHNHIGEIDHTGKLVPELAQSWEPTPDARTWTIKLRTDVEFHNGKMLEASDVVASVDYHRSERSKSPARALLASVESVRAVARDTVEVRLSSGYADFPFALSDYHIAILPAVDGKVDAGSGIGAGPYALERFEPGVGALLKRNENYWKADSAWFDEVELVSIIDVAARTAALRSGDVDVMDRCDSKTVHLLSRSRGLRVADVAGTAHCTFPMRTDVAPFDNNEVRLALKHAVDRQALVDIVLKGHGAPGNDHPVSATDRFYAQHLQQREYDPDKVRYHLGQAGLDTLKLKLSTSEAAFAGAVDAAVLYSTQAARAGITIDVVREASDGYWSKVWMKKPWSMSYWSGRPTADWMFSTAYSDGADWNESRWRHPRFNTLLVEARAELDEARRAQMYAELQRLVRDEGGSVVPMFYNHLFAMSDNVQHGELRSNWELDGRKFAERWWFDPAAE